MAIIAYTGVMGSGKTYEAVSTAALTALKNGRRVVTNIRGFNFEAIRKYLGPFEDGAYLESGRVVVVPSSRLSEPNFFYDPESSAESVVKPGDLVLIDEAWATWPNGTKIPEEHQVFFRMHRHYVEQDSGLSCDVCIMIQDLAGLHRDIRGVLETNYKFTKLKSLGVSSRYRIEVYEGGTRQREMFVSSSIKKYDKAIFPLYQSYEGTVGHEGTVDKRQNLLANKWLLCVFIFGFTLAVTGIFSFFTWLCDLDGSNVANIAVDQQVFNAAPASPPAPSAARASSSGHRLVMVLEATHGESFAIIETAEGRFERQAITSGVIDGWRSVVGYEGDMVGFVFGGEGT